MRVTLTGDEKMTTTMKAYCRNCESVQEHRFVSTDPIQEIVCNNCHSIAITFHERMTVHPWVEPERMHDIEDGNCIHCGCHAYEAYNRSCRD